MTGKERVLAALDRSGPDRIPIGDSFWDDTIVRWRSEGLPPGTSPAEYFDFDIRFLSIDPSPRFPVLVLDESGDEYVMQDRFGYVARRRRSSSLAVDYDSYPVTDRTAWDRVRAMLRVTPGEPALIDTTGYPFRLEADIGWKLARSRVEKLRSSGAYLLASAYGPREASWRLRGFEQVLYDEHDDPELLVEIADAYTDHLIRVIDRCIEEQTRPDGFFMVEDLGSTRGMLFSPETWRAAYRGPTQRLGKFLRSRGLGFWMHCCGDAREVFDDLIDCGLQVIQPLEAKAGLDVRDLVARYGSRLTFFGNISVQNMARGRSDIEGEIRDKLAAFRDGRGGYIYHSDHSVPPEVSFDAYRFVIDCVRRYGAAKPAPAT